MRIPGVGIDGVPIKWCDDMDSSSPLDIRPVRSFVPSLQPSRDEADGSKVGRWK